MKMKTFIMFFLLFALSGLNFAQPIPADSLYLGQIPPGEIPKIFSLPVTKGYFAAERIAISEDGKEIYYSETSGYSPTSKNRIRLLRYSNNNWNKPITLFEGLGCPALSYDGNYLFENGLYSIKTDRGWSMPVWFLNRQHQFHYLQDTYSGTHYASAKNALDKVGENDWSKIIINKSDTLVQSLGLPLNTSSKNMDFFISGDESYIIIASGGLKISFNKKDGTWTNPKSLGPNINSFLGEWGPYVTKDNKYLFFTAGTKKDYSDTYIRWVRIDNVISSLRFTNFIPWIKSPIPNKSFIKGSFIQFQIPENTFIDDDGNNTLHYSATLNNTNRLPVWLNFDPESRIFSGRATEAGEFNIKVTATDKANASVSCIFIIIVIDIH
jgi:Putative Ig domain